MREVRVAVATILEKTLDSALFYQDKVGLIFKITLNDAFWFHQMFLIVCFELENLKLECGKSYSMKCSFYEPTF